MSKKGLFISLEGLDHSGKTTFKDFIASQLQTQRIPFISTHEPGGTLISERIRDILLYTKSSDEPIDPLTELLLINAARRQHVKYLIRPYLEEGYWVICDRFFDSTLAYQSAGKEISKKLVNLMHEWVASNLMPDKTFYFRLPLSLMETRAAKANKETHLDRFESMPMTFHQSVYDAYEEFYENDRERFILVESDQAKPLIEKQIQKDLHNLIYEWRS